MATTYRNQLREVMNQAWTLVKTYGFSMAEAMKKAWMLLKLKNALNKGIVKFYYEKLNGEIRSAWGTLLGKIVPATGENARKKNDSVQTYFDTDRGEWRCFKKANLIKIA